MQKVHPSHLVGSYEERKFPAFREPTVDTLMWGRKRHHIPVLIEVDVTTARELIREYKINTGQKISFTGWIVKCVAQTVSEYKPIHAIRKGKRRLIVFDDVDVSVIVERSVGEGETLPMPYIIRKANEKNVTTIHNEIRAAQQHTRIRGNDHPVRSRCHRWRTRCPFHPKIAAIDNEWLWVER